MARFFRNFVIGSALIAVSCSFLVAESMAQLRPIRWEVKAAAQTNAPKSGATVPILISAEIFEGWYFYSITQPEGGPIRATFSLPAGQPFKLTGPVKGPKPKVKFDKTFGINVESYDGTAVFSLPIRIAKGSNPGTHKLKIEVRFQACNGEICLRPRTDTLELDVDVK